MDTTSIILCGGKINFLNLPITTNTSNSMIPVNGKPVISWILEDLIQKGYTNTILIHRAEDLHLKQFLVRTFCTKMQLTLISLDESPSILHSLKASFELISPEHPVQIILGDTLIRDSFEIETDAVYTHLVEDSSRWCIAEANDAGYISQYFDKQENLNQPLNALCGYYRINHPRDFFHILSNSILSGKTEISDALFEYGKLFPVKMLFACQWFDFGNIENLLAAKRQLLQSRYFNKLSIHPVLNTITKESEFDDKLRNELQWYEKLPAELSVLTPRILSKAEKNGHLIFTQEYYGYPTLSELYLYSDLSAESWHGILKKLFEIVREFGKYREELENSELLEIYLNKTFNRLEILISEAPTWDNLFSANEIQINGKSYHGFRYLKNELERFAQKMIANAKSGILHGDFCFSNILFDLNSQIVKLIDPRGSFGKVGIYGDQRYDMAKLRHSIHGLYDYIVSDLFEIQVSGCDISCNIFSNGLPDQVTADFDKQLLLNGYDLHEIQFIEGLLFISMLPFHKDKPRRQEMMFVQGIILLNKILGSNAHSN